MEWRQLTHSRIVVMRAIEIAESTPKITLGFAEVDQPRPGPGQILIAVHAAGVTRTELNWYPSTHTASGMPRLRVIPGHEFSGVVAALGDSVSEENLDTLIVRCGGTHHALTPPVFANPLRDDCTRTIEAIERDRDVLVKLRAMVCRSVADAVDHFLRNSIGVGGRLHKGRRYRADENRFDDASCSVARDIASDFSAAR